MRKADCRQLPALVALLTVLGCASTPSPSTGPSLPVLQVEHLGERALLLMLADRKSYEPLVIHQALEGNADLRRQTALTLARVGDRRGGPALETLLGDPEAAVRRAAAFALGELGEQGYAQGEPALLGALLDRDRETGRLAVEALAKLGTALEDVVQRLIEGPSAELFPRLLPALFRFDNPAVVRWAEQGLEQSDAGSRAMAAYALGREPRPEGLALLRALLNDGDPWIRGLGARGLGRVGERGDLERLRPLLDDAAPGPIIQALRGAYRLISDGKSAPPRDWQPRLLELLADARPGVRLTAIESSAAWLLDEELGAALGELGASGVRRERELALLALAEGEDPRGAVLLVRLAGSSDPVLRDRAAQAAGFFRAVEVLDQLAEDPNPGVRRTVLETRLAGEPADAAELVRGALRDSDPTVRAQALTWAEEHPVLEVEVLFAAMDPSWRDRLIDARTAGVGALVARAQAAEAERQAIITLLEALGRDDDFLLRRRAARGLAELGQEPPPIGAVRVVRSADLYRQIVQRTSRPRRVDLLTEKGSVGIELTCPEAPLTCLNFLQLAGQGYYEGLRFHRVVPDFVVQAGDPRGDGWGGPGFAIRDEMNTLRYRRGRVGMALSGPDTGGSQFFITLAPQPHLDGGYTIFGRVVAGDEVLDRIVQGDSILQIVEVAAN
ncbi:MAG: peptidylprolyl isomerase [Acidobacteriota bacterium]